MKWPDHKSLPMVLAGVEVRVSRVLNLTMPTVANALEPFLKAEKAHWRSMQARHCEAVSQAIGRAARVAGMLGLVAASQQVPDGRNMVVFPGQFGRDDQLSAPKLRVVIGNNS
jgi:hypothetical protein